LNSLRLTIYFLLVFSLTTAKTNAVNTASDLDENELSALEKGETIVRVQESSGRRKATVEATILIDAPADRVWRVMTDCEAAPAFVPGLMACQVLETGHNWEIIRHETEWMWFLPRVTYVFLAVYQEHRQIDFKRIRGDLREMRGSWRLLTRNRGKHTIVRYRVYLDPGFYVPQWIVRLSLKRNLPAVLAALRKKVYSIR
jgi:uncharacterized membrane protein